MEGKRSVSRLDAGADHARAEECAADLRRSSDAAGSGGWPSEEELVARYDLTLQTAREVLRRLRGVGEPVARPRTFPEIEQPAGALYSLFRVVESHGVEQRSTVRTLDVRRDPEVAARLGVDPEEDLVYLERLRLAGDEPLALDRTWLPASYASPVLDADFSHAALYDELQTRCGVRPTGGCESIQAVVPTPEQQHVLGVGRSVALLAIQRIGDHEGQRLEWRETLVRGDRFGLTAEWAPTMDYRLAVAAPPDLVDDF